MVGSAGYSDMFDSDLFDDVEVNSLLGSACGAERAVSFKSGANDNVAPLVPQRHWPENYPPSCQAAGHAGIVGMRR